MLWIYNGYAHAPIMSLPFGDCMNVETAARRQSVGDN